MKWNKTEALKNDLKIWKSGTPTNKRWNENQGE